MSPSEMKHYIDCPCCGVPVVRIYNAGTGCGVPHMCNSIIYDEPREEKPRVKPTFKNSDFFNKHKRSNGKIN